MSNDRKNRVFLSYASEDLPKVREVYDGLIKSDLQRVDMGIAMCHFELSVNETGQKGSWMIKDPGIKNLPGETEYITTWAAGG